MKALTAPDRFVVFSMIDQLMSRQRNGELGFDRYVRMIDRGLPKS
jgi:hypothetical protein